ncbi:MAG: hypothetical protein ORN29_08395 [Rhodoferax sp.]|nr:hypothetical protein [Rhodoferax sp.]
MPREVHPIQPGTLLLAPIWQTYAAAPCGMNSLKPNLRKLQRCNAAIAR